MLTRAPDPTPAAELERIAGEVRRLRPDWRDAEAFYETRSEIAGALMRLARRLAGRAMPAPMPIPLHRPVVVRAVAARIPAPVIVAAPPSAPRRLVRPRHRYPRPPLDLQPRFI
jgi:hypothetical protein